MIDKDEIECIWNIADTKSKIFTTYTVIITSIYVQ